MGRSERREQRRWQRELEEQLRALPTYEGETPDGGQVAPVGRRLPRQPRASRRERRAARAADRSGTPYVRPARGPGSERRRTVATVAVTLGVIAVVFGASSTPVADSVQGVLGWSGDRGDSTAYAFLAEDQLTGQPYRWSSCDPIRYAVNPSRAPDGWEDTLGDAIGEVSEATGLEFVDEGTTDAGPESARFARGDRPEPVLVSWVGPEEEPALEGDIVGVAGPASLGRVWVTGSVLLDAPAFAAMEDRGADDLQRAVIMHELGHLVGLDHVDDERQLMYSKTTFQTTFGTGDLEGLRTLGEGPCA